jgi:hypothetical protein
MRHPQLADIASRAQHLERLDHLEWLDHLEIGHPDSRTLRATSADASPSTK